MPWSVGLVCALAWHPGRAASPQLRDLAPAQVFAAPQIHVAPPRPLPDTPGTEPMFSGMGYVDPESAPDIPYSFFWQEEDTNAWRRRHVSDASPGLRGARGWHRPSRRLRSPWLARQNDTAWTLGSSNWRYSSKQGLDVTLGNEEIVVPAWGNSTRMSGVSISQSSLAGSGDSENWQYSMSIGALDYASNHDQGDLTYGPTASNTVLRYGLSPDFTLESQLEVAPNLLTSGLGGNYSSRWGVWSAGVARARYGLDQGWRYQAAYKVNLLDDLQLSWLNERHTAGFTDLSRYQDGVSPGGMRQRWTATVPTGRWGDVSGVYENEYSSTGNTRRSFGVSQQFWYSPNLRIGLKAERELVSGDYDIGLRFSVPIY